MFSREKKPLQLELGLGDHRNQRQAFNCKMKLLNNELIFKSRSLSVTCSTLVSVS